MLVVLDGLVAGLDDPPQPLVGRSGALELQSNILLFHLRDGVQRGMHHELFHAWKIAIRGGSADPGLVGHVRHREGLAFREEFGGTFDERNMRSQLLICASSREIGRCSAYFCQNKSLSSV